MHAHSLTLPHHSNCCVSVGGLGSVCLVGTFSFLCDRRVVFRGGTTCIVGTMIGEGRYRSPTPLRCFLRFACCWMITMSPLRSVGIRFVQPLHLPVLVCGECDKTRGRCPFLLPGFRRLRAWKILATVVEAYLWCHTHGKLYCTQKHGKCHHPARHANPNHEIMKS